jgi:hypothetical protein
MTRSLRHRLYRRHQSPYVRAAEHIVSPYADRLRGAALGDHVCQRFVVTVKEPG